MEMTRILKTVKISDIRIDGDTQSREEMDASWIQEIVNNLKHDIVYEPVEARFDGSQYWLSDGFHRYFAYKQLNVKEINVRYLSGSQFDAQIDSYGANAKHGRMRTRADKEKAVRKALQNPLLKDKSNTELAKICIVSISFVGAVRNPDVKKKQQETNEKRIIKKAKEIEENRSATTHSDKKTTNEPDPYAGQNPSDEEVKASELALQVYLEEIESVMSADDKLTAANEQIKKLTQLNATLELRLHGLMNEKNEAVKMVKDLQRQLDKLKGKK